MTDLENSSPIGRLLWEISWEGNAERYHEGGRGRENVLTTEVFAALDYLPRTAFLGEVLRAAHGAKAARESVAATMEETDVRVLPGDIRGQSASGEPTTWTVQPDVRLDTPTTLCLVEAKRIRSSRFQERQLARTLHALFNEAGDRTPLLLLVLGEPPPVSVAKLGRISIAEALEHGLPNIGGPVEQDAARQRASATIAWITWQEISDVVTESQSDSRHLVDMR